MLLFLVGNGAAKVEKILFEVTKFINTAGKYKDKSSKSFASSSPA